MNDLREIYFGLKTLLQRYSPPFVAKVDTDSAYELWLQKEIVIDGRKYRDCCFAMAKVQKNHVTLHFMPIYGNDRVKQAIHPDLLSKLKGKACFHIKEWNDTVRKQVDSALQEGFICYKTNGWVSE